MEQDELIGKITACDIIDPETGESSVISSGGLLGAPTDIAVSPDGRVFVVDVSLGAVIEIDPLSGSQSLVTSGVPLVSPFGLDVSPTGQILVADRDAVDGDGAIISVDPGDGTKAVISQTDDTFGFFIANEPWDIVADPSSGTLFVADSGVTLGSGSIYSVDPESGAAALVSSQGDLVDPRGIALLVAASEPVPEPATLGLVVFAVAGAGVALRRQRRRARRRESRE